jgi:protein-S-isoprenylcysteine O-methyltransferase Ste14
MHMTLQIIVFAFAAIWFANVFRLGASRKLMYNSTEGPLLALAVRVFFAMAIGTTLAIALDAHVFPWSYVAIPRTLRIAGAVMAFTGEALFVWVIATLGRNYSTSLVIRKHHTLIISGPYKYARHPMYTAFAIYFAGISLLSENVLVAASAALALIVTMIVRTPKEEAMMLEHFGEDYREYMKRTGRYAPRRR